MLLEDFDYELPPELIAAKPHSPRDQSRLMAVNRQTGGITHRIFHNLTDLLEPGDLLVINNSKVLHARLFGENSKGKSFEIFLLKQKNSEPPCWECLVRPGKKIFPNIPLSFPGGVHGFVKKLSQEIYDISFPDLKNSEFFPWLEKQGSVPLPPYIKRKSIDSDDHDYQTIYAKALGSVAAPTAGFHFSKSLLNQIQQKGIHIAEITLHIGYGTFSPIRCENIEEHLMHEETYSVSDEVFDLLHETKKSGKRIIPVGTTSLRTLESLPLLGKQGNTSLFISPGFTFQWADGLITNFHLPKSSLYVLVAAFLGLPHTRKCYEQAIQRGYRFYSYGDAMAIL